MKGLYEESTTNDGHGEKDYQQRVMLTVATGEVTHNTQQFMLLKSGCYATQQPLSNQSGVRGMFLCE
eukprot:scaffold147015_cov36-Cyclotella_meneghiniana.AAC.1